jgi:hypothetical protein
LSKNTAITQIGAQRICQNLSVRTMMFEIEGNFAFLLLILPAYFFFSSSLRLILSF